MLHSDLKVLPKLRYTLRRSPKCAYYLGDSALLSSARQDLDLNERDSGYAAKHARRMAVVSTTPFHFQRFI
jgi:hypothetical protein